MILPVLLTKEYYSEFAEHLSSRPYTLFHSTKFNMSVVNHHIFESVDSALDYLDSKDVIIATRAGSKSSEKYMLYHACGTIVNNTLHVDDVFIEEDNQIEYIVAIVINLVFIKHRNISAIYFPFIINGDNISEQIIHNTSLDYTNKGSVITLIDANKK